MTSKEFFPVAERWEIPAAAWAVSIAEMAIDGRAGNEGVALWLGNNVGGVVMVTHVVLLRGAGVLKEPAFLNIDADIVNEVADLALASSTVLIGQVHSHGRYFGTDLSETDRRYGIAVPGYLSCVAPDFAQRPDTRLHDCGAHVFEEGRWRRLDDSEAVQRLLVTAGPAAVLIAGGIND